jgi:MFS family permease
VSLPNPPAGPFAALQYREYRLLWTGQAFSMVGTRMQQAALLWHVYELTRSPFALGILGLVRVVPLVTFALLGGVAADALDRRRVMLISQTLTALLAAFLGTWTLLGLKQVWPIYVVAGLAAGVGAFDAPARQSLIPQLVPRELLARAVSLNSITTQAAAVLGPALMGLLIMKLSVGTVYIANAVSFLGVIGALLVMRPIPPAEGEERPQIGKKAILEGLHYMRGARLLTSLMLLDFLATFFSSASTLLPVYAREILHTNPFGYGLLVAASPIGAVLAGAVMSVLPTIQNQGRVVLWAVFFYGVATIIFGASALYWLCFLGLAGTGAADTVSTVLRQTIRQLTTPDYLRGRMTSINQLFVQGGPQLGELESGFVAGWFGAPLAVMSGGVGCIVVVAAMSVLAPWLRDYRSDPARKH